MPAELSIHTATDEDFLAVIGLFEAALLDVETDRLRALLTDTDPGFVLLATTTGRSSDSRSTGRRPVGAIAVDTAFGCDPGHRNAHIVAIAVRPQRRGRGIGRTLIELAADRVAPRPLSARFDPRVRPFYAACGFDIEPRDGRLWGIRDAAIAGHDDADRDAANSADADNSADRDAANSAASSVNADRDPDDAADTVAADTVDGRR